MTPRVHPAGDRHGDRGGRRDAGRARSQLALVATAAAPTRPVGFVALEDLLEEVIGEFDDETDPVPRGRGAARGLTRSRGGTARVGGGPVTGVATR